MVVSTVLLAIVAIAGFCLVRVLLADQARKRRLPPGPKGLPIVGNINDLPSQDQPEWRHWLRHKDLYGPISSVTVLGQTIVVIHDREMAFEILEKQAVKNSSRPEMVFAGSMVGYAKVLTMHGYDAELRDQRKLIASQLGHKPMIDRFHAAQQLESRRFLLRNLNEPDGVVEHLNREAGALMVSILYGYAPKSQGRDPLIKLINNVMDEFSQASVPGAWIVDMVPWLRYLPNWVPGTDFKRSAALWSRHLQQSIDVPFDFVRKQMASGSTSFKPSIVSGLLEKAGDALDDKLASQIKYASNALYGGGSDTVVATLHLFFVAMMLHPAVQAKAQAEIDAATGGTRLPNFEDRLKLPYVDAVVKETLRWANIAPLGVAHRADADSEVHGHLIPKGAILLPSIAWLSYDPDTYPDPSVFNPERFLGDADGQQPNPSSHCFGFGRRLCPGRLLADSYLFINIAQSLAAFDIRKPVDEKGREVEPEIVRTPGVVSHLRPVAMSIKPRSAMHAELIRQVELEFPEGEGDAGKLEAFSS